MRQIVLGAIQRAMDEVGCRGPFASFEHASTSVRSALDRVRLAGMIEAWQISEDADDPNVLFLDIRETFSINFERLKVNLIVDPEMRKVWEVMEC